MALDIDQRAFEVGQNFGAEPYHPRRAILGMIIAKAPTINLTIGLLLTVIGKMNLKEK